MSRSPTRLDDFYTHQEQVQPTARPTDQFVSPSARLRNGGSELASFANSLKTIEPIWSQIADRQAAGVEKASQAAAEADYANRRWSNVQDFKKAVDSGAVPQAQNPWYAIRTKQLFAQDKMASALSQATKDWQTNPAVRDSDDPAVVQKFFADHMTGAMQGMDPWEAEVAAPFSQQAVQHLMSQHWAQRDHTRVQEAEVAYKQNLFNILSTHGIDEQTAKDMKSADPAVAQAANARYQQAQAAIQQALNNQLTVSNKVEVNKWTHDALSQAALSREEGSVFGLYMGLKKADGSTLDLSASDHQRDLDRIISDRKFHTLREEHEKQSLQDTEYHREAKIGWQNYLAKRKEDNPNFTQLDVTVEDASAFAKTLPPQIREQFFNDVAQQYYSANNMTGMYRTEQAKRIIMENAADIGSGRLNNTPEVRNAINIALLKLGDATMVHQIGVDLQFAGKQWPPQTSSEALHAWYDLRDSGKPVTKADVDGLVQQYDGQLSREDVGRMYDHTFLQHHESQARSEPIYQRAAANLYRQIDTKFVDERLANPPEDIKPLEPWAQRKEVEQRVAAEPSYKNALMDARNELGRTYERLMRDPEMKKQLAENPEQFEAELLKRVDDISTRVGGYNAEQFKSSQSKLLQTKEPAKPQADLPTKLYPPGSHEAAIVNASINKTLPDYAVLPMAQQEKVNAILSQPPAGLSATQREEVAPPPEPHFRWSRLRSPAPDDWAGQLSTLRNNIRDMPTIAQGEQPSLGLMILKKKFNTAASAARAQASAIEMSLPVNTPDVYKRYTDLSDNGASMAPSNWVELRKLENKRLEAVYLRQGAGYDPVDVKYAMENGGNKDAWKTKPMFLDLDDFHPNNAKKLMETMQYLGLNPKDKLLAREFLARQQQLTSELLARQ